MVDVDKAALHRYVLSRMVEHDFRRMFTATAPDGTRPIVVAMRDEQMTSVIEEIEVRGGAASVVVPHKNGFVVISMEGVPGQGCDRHRQTDVETINAHCTVGVFVERLRMDGPSTYSFKHNCTTGLGQAELSGVGELVP